MAELLDLATEVLRHASSGEEVEAYALHRTATTVQAGSGGVVRHVGRAETRGVGIRLLRDARVGYASTADPSPAGLEATVVRARRNAAASDPDEAVALPAPETLTANASLRADTVVTAALEVKVGLVADLARRVTALDPRVLSIDTAEYRDQADVTVVASTRGVRSEERHGYAELSADAVGESPHGIVSDYGYWCGRDLTSVDIGALAGEAVARTTRLMGDQAAPPVDAPVVLDRDVVGALLAAVGRACTGGALSSGRSMFARMRNSLVADPGVNLWDDGLSARSPLAARFDGEGVPRRRTTLIRDGVLVGAMHTTTTARAVGGDARTTGNAQRMTHKSAPRAAATALLLEPTCTLEELLAAAGDATYMQQLSGLSGINPITGRVNVGAMGFLLRDGRPAGRLPTRAVATSLQAFLSSIQQTADDGRAIPGSPVLAATVLCAPSWLAPI